MNLFVNPTEQRLRSGWRLGIQFLLFLLFSILMFALKNELISGNLNMVQALILMTSAVLSVFVSARFLDHRSMMDFGLNISKTWWLELFTGLLSGSVAMILIFLTMWFSGWVEVTGFGWDRVSSQPYALWFGSYFLTMICVGFYEELIFRGYQIVNLTEGFQRPGWAPEAPAALAVAISSAVFGIMHLGTPGASWVSTVNIMVAGIVLALPFLLTGRLALSIGLHISWNFMQGGVFDLPVSGKVFRGSLIQVQQEGPALFTGGSFGPEAGLLGCFGMLIMLACLYLYLIRSSSSYSLHLIFRDARVNPVKNR